MGVHDNFFDLGGHSLKLVQVQRRLQERTGRELSIIDLFRYPTITALAEHLAAADETRAVAHVAPSPAPAESAAIAIVGMAGRFPGAASVDELWRKLCAGEELIRVFGNDELRAAGVDPALLDDPHYVRARGVLDGADLFDAGFFDYAPREAQLIDPQQRVFLECAWEALEDAGHGARPERRRVGVFAGTGESGYAWDVHADPELVRAVGAYQVSLGTKQDYLPTRVSYKLDLEGPERQRADRLLDLARGGPLRLPGTARRGVRRGAGGRRRDRCAAAARLPLGGRAHLLARRALPRLRRAGAPAR